MRILITGGAGFIGSHLTQHLLTLDHQIIIFDNFSTGKIENLNFLQNYPGRYQIHYADILDQNTLSLVFQAQKIDLVYHLAAAISVEESIQNPQKYQEINVQGTKNILEEIAGKGIRLVYASSAAVYGTQQTNIISEDLQTNPQSPYAETKLMGEDLIKESDLPATILRFFNAYGPKQDINSGYAAVIPKFINRIKQKKPLIIYGDGKQTRDFIYVTDIIEALYLSGFSEIPQLGPFNVGTGKETSLNDLIITLQKVLQLPIQYIQSSTRNGDIKHSMANIEKIQELGFNPKYNLFDGLRNLN